MMYQSNPPLSPKETLPTMYDLPSEDQGIHRQWLRWFDEGGIWLPTPTEQEQKAYQQAQQERERAEQFAAKLRELGIEPNEV